MEEKKLSPAAALKQYMQSGRRGRKCDLKELKALSGEERTALGIMTIEAIEKGWE